MIISYKTVSTLHVVWCANAGTVLLHIVHAGINLLLWLHMYNSDSTCFHHYQNIHPFCRLKLSSHANIHSIYPLHANAILYSLAIEFDCVIGRVVSPLAIWFRLLLECKSVGSFRTILPVAPFAPASRRWRLKIIIPIWSSTWLHGCHS